LTLVGIQPDDLEVGVELSPTIAQMMLQLIARAEQIAQEWK
jgi:hypothetical protein